MSGNMNPMGGNDNLIPLMDGSIGGESVRTVNLRDLHGFLEVGKRFADWIKDRIGQYGFIEGSDYVRVSQNRETSTGGTTVIEYHGTLDMAKELAMVERNERGKQARLYFIECERRLRAGDVSPATLAGRVAPVFEDFFSIGRLVGLDHNQSALGANRATKILTGIDALEMIGAPHLVAPQQAPHITATQIGLKLGGRTGGKPVSARTANQLLEKHGFQEKDPHTDGGWNCTEKGKAHAVWLDTGRKHSGGAAVRQLRWAETVVNALISAMEDASLGGLDDSGKWC